MLMIQTKKQQRESVKRLIKFCKDNHCLMYNYMLTIEQIRAEPEDKAMMERLKKQADDYKRQSEQK